MSIRFDAWLPEEHPNSERLRQEIERSQTDAREISRKRRARKRGELLFPWSLAIVALAVVFIAAILLDLH